MRNIVFITLFVLSGFLAVCQDAESIFQKGNSLSLKGKYKEALNYVNRSLELDSSLYQRYGFRAEIKTNLGMYESAIQDITKCINKCTCPTRKYHVASYYLERAELYIKKGDSQSALNDANSSIRTNPNEWKAYVYRSKLLLANSKNAKALSDLNKAITLDNNQAESFIMRGELLIKMGDKKAACQDFSKVLGWGFDEYELWIKKNCQ
ncbi:MAG: hypothetical protein KTR26_06345 [Flammeovirgaceae bacterium]|nr:hypothetical protein [Flammeovirgaceae bacterium]